jgi:hypothetical protein
LGFWIARFLIVKKEGFEPALVILFRVFFVWLAWFVVRLLKTQPRNHPKHTKRTKRKIVTIVVDHATSHVAVKTSHDP